MRRLASAIVAPAIVAPAIVAPAIVVLGLVGLQVLAAGCGAPTVGSGNDGGADDDGFFVPLDQSRPRSDGGAVEDATADQQRPSVTVTPPSDRPIAEPPPDMGSGDDAVVPSDDGSPPPPPPSPCDAPPDENGPVDDFCGGATQLSVNEDSTQAADALILPASDQDVYSVTFVGASHVCVPFTSQSFSAVVSVTGPFTIDYNLETCDNTWQAGGSGLCLSWQGTCGSNDDKTFHFMVHGDGGRDSCDYYELTVQFCKEGETCPGC